ncbi:WSC-domain-containing protein, partial [Parachaetomium inaequale]
TSLGCWSDNHNRALQGRSTSSNSMTTEMCASFCSEFAIFGTEFGSQCFCGNVLWSGAQFEDPRVGCTSPCQGNGGETCGGTWALSIYTH